MRPCLILFRPIPVLERRFTQVRYLQNGIGFIEYDQDSTASLSAWYSFERADIPFVIHNGFNRSYHSLNPVNIAVNYTRSVRL
jgi:hypothetical protein